MKPALVFALSLSLFAVACSDTVSQPEKPKKLTRESALNLLNKYSNMPQVLQPHIIGHINLCVRHDQTNDWGQHTRTPFDDDYFSFLTKLAKLGILKRDKSKDVSDTPSGMFGGVLPGADCFSAMSQELHPVGDGINQAAEFLVATQTFREVTGIREEGPGHAEVYVTMIQQPTPMLNRFIDTYSEVLAENAGKQHLNTIDFLLRAGISGLPLRDQQKRYPFTKYDDGWRLGN